MPMKIAVSSKAEAARARRSAAETERREKITRAAEEEYWKEAEGPKSKSAKKREEAEEKRAEAARRKAENRKLAEAEWLELETTKTPEKVTMADLRRWREEEELRLRKEAELEKRRRSRTAAVEEYKRTILVRNTNREEESIEARSVEEAILKMSPIQPALIADRRPDRRILKKQSLRRRRERIDLEIMAEISGEFSEKPNC